jgi:hypothetical protein
MLYPDLRSDDLTQLGFKNKTNPFSNTSGQFYKPDEESEKGNYNLF